MLECQAAVTLLLSRMDRPLGRRDQVALEEHLKDCQPCRVVDERFKKRRGLSEDMTRSLRKADGSAERPDESDNVPYELDLDPPPRIKGFEIIGFLGSGSMGGVYKARRITDGRLVAVKLLPTSLARDGEYFGRFMREAREGSKLDHPNVVRGVGFGRAGKTYYYAMEYVEGTSLIDQIDELGRLPDRRAAQICLEIARALEYAAGLGLVHRDLKPGNILLTRDGTAKLCDLGLIKTTREDSGLTQDGFVVGTPHYIAPEQARGDPDLDIRADIYGLGCTLYHMLTGDVPFDDESATNVMTMHLKQPFPDPRRIVPDIAPGLLAVLYKMVEKKRSQRYQTAEDLRRDLEAFLNGSLRHTSSQIMDRATLELLSRRPLHARKGGSVWRSGMGIGMIASAVAAFALALMGLKYFASDSREPPAYEAEITPR